MKKQFLGLIVASLLFNTAFSASNTRVPDEFYVSQHWVSYTTSYDINSKTQKLGTLYRHVLSLLLTYDFYDNTGEKLAYARSKFFSATAQFTVRDQEDELIGTTEEQLFSFFPSFSIYGNDGTSKLAYAAMNFWGTKFTIYDPATDQEMAVMSRTFFRVKNNWTVKITNKSLFNQKNIDSRLLMTVLAFQGEREYWEQQNKNRNKSVKSSTRYSALGTKAAVLAEEVEPTINVLLANIKKLESEQGLNQQSSQVDPTVLETVANELQTNFDATHFRNDLNLTTQEKIQQFTNYCFDQIKSQSISADQKRVIIALLKMRLETGAV